MKINMLQMYCEFVLSNQLCKRNLKPINPMTTAFVLIAACAAIVFFILWLNERNERKSLSGVVNQTSSHDVTKTYLTPDNVKEVIRNNGFIPLPYEGNDWIPFKWQGEVYFVSSDTLPGVQFFKNYTLDENDDIELYERAAQMTKDKIWPGYVNIEQSSDVRTLNFRVFAIEKTVEHFTETFMDYMHSLNEEVDCFRYFYNQLLEQKDRTGANKERSYNVSDKHGLLS